MRSAPVVPVLLLAGLAACSDGAAPSSGTPITFNLTTGSRAAAAPLAQLLSDTIVGADDDTLVLDKVELVLRDIRFKRIDDDVCEGDDDFDDDDDDSTSSSLRAFSRHDDDDDDDDACEYFNAGPFLLDLPLDGGVDRAFTVLVGDGTYDELRIKLHKPEDDSGDPADIAFLNDHPDFRKISIRASGSFNGQPFTFESDLNAQQRMDLVPPLVVADSVASVDITIKVDLDAWFQDGAGGLVDPATANKGGPNDNLVKDNIRDSFHAFRDDNRDGHDDCDDDDRFDD